MKIKDNLTGIIMTAAALILLIGNNSWFKVCGPKDDGSFMACHWTGRMITACALLMLVLSAAHFIMKDHKASLALDLATGCAALMTLLTPGTIGGLCGNAEMMCRTHTQPWTIGLSAVIILATAADAFFARARMEDEKHRRA